MEPLKIDFHKLMTRLKNVSIVPWPNFLFYFIFIFDGALSTMISWLMVSQVKYLNPKNTPPIECCVA